MSAANELVEGFVRRVRQRQPRTARGHVVAGAHPDGRISLRLSSNQGPQSARDGFIISPTSAYQVRCFLR